MHEDRGGCGGHVGEGGDTCMRTGEDEGGSLIFTSEGILSMSELTSESTVSLSTPHTSKHGCNRASHDVAS